MSDHPHRSVSLPEFLWLIDLHKKASNIYVVDLLNKAAENRMYRYYSVWLVDNRTIGMTIGCLADVIGGRCKDAYIYRGLADAEYRDRFIRVLDYVDFDGTDLGIVQKAEDGMGLAATMSANYNRYSQLRSLALYTIGEDSETQNAK